MDIRFFSNRFFPVALCVATAACSSDVSAPGSEEGPAEVVRPFAAAELGAAANSNAFGVSLYRTIAAADASANVIVSPLSVSMALGMALNGAEDSTFMAMRNVLGFAGSDMPSINKAYRGLIAQLRARRGTTEFRLANALWYRQGFDVRAPFLDATRTSFGAHVQALDFSRADAAGTISKWAENETGGRIKDLVDEVKAEDMMFLINAVYFKAPWRVPFEPSSTRNQTFTRADGSTVSVPMMSATETHGVLKNGEVRAVELMYGDTTFSMVLLAPAGSTTLSQLTASLTAARWSAWMDAIHGGRVVLTMPKFRFDYDVTMNDALKAQGMAVAFDPLRADFDGIPVRAQDDLHISKVRQKAFIDVHELGTEAAAATSVTVGVTSMPPEMRFDRPFLFVIRERSSGAILFMGRVGDPSKQ